MQLLLKTMWQSTKNLVPVNVGNEFINIRQSWNDRDLGIAPSNRVSSSGAVTFPANTVSSAYTISDLDFLILGNTTSAFTITLPDATTIQGRLYVVMNVGSKVLTIVTTSSQTINGNTSTTLPNKYFHIQLFSDGSNWVAI